MRGSRLIGALAAFAVTLPLVPALGLVAGALRPAPGLFPGQGDAGWAALLRGPDGAPGPLAVSLALALLVSAAALPLGAALAWAEQRLVLPGGRWLGVATLLPLALPSYVLAGTLRHALGPGGWLGGPLGLPTPAGLGPAVLALTLATAPYVQLLVGASLARCPADEEEAARSLGAGRLAAFRVATLPRLRPALAASLLLVQLYTVSDFGAVAVLDCRALTWRLYQAVATARLDVAWTLGAGVMALTAPLLVAARALHGRPPPPGVTNPRPVAPVRPGPALRAAAVGLQLGVVTLGVVVPLATLCVWVAEGAARGLPFAGLAEPLGHSIGVALAGAASTTLLAVCPAWVAVRAGRWTSWATEQAVYLTGALPGILLAFGLLLAALHGAEAAAGPRAYHALLGSGALLLVGYATRFLAEAFASLRAGAALVDPRLEESARVLGAGPWRRASRVVAPQLAPAGAAAFALTAVAIVKELPVSLLLGGPAGLRPLSFRMVDRYQEALLHDAGAAGLLIAGLGFAAFALTLRWRLHV